jgi:class 3 adenylate cyclase
MRPFHQSAPLVRRAAYGLAAGAVVPLLFWCPALALWPAYLLTAPGWLASAAPGNRAWRGPGVEGLGLGLALVLGIALALPRVGLAAAWLLVPATWLVAIWVLCQLAEGGARQLRSAGWFALPVLAAAGLVAALWPAAPLAGELQTAGGLPGPVLVSALLLQGLFVALAGLFAGLGFGRARRQHRARAHLLLRNDNLDQINRRFARYLPVDLRARVERAPRQRLALEQVWLAVVFVDLADFTARTRALPAAGTAHILNDFQALLAELAKARAGTLSKLLGDGALIVFGAAPGCSTADSPAARQRAAAGALAFAEAVLASLAALRCRWRDLGLLTDVRARAAVTAGYCSVGDWGAEQLDYAVIGDAVNLAARLQALAAPDSLLLDDVAATLARAGRSPLALVPRTVAVKGHGVLRVWQRAAGQRVDPPKGSAMVADASAGASPTIGDSAPARPPFARDDR